MANNIQKSNPQELYDSIASVTGATKEQVDAFAKEMGLSVADIASSEPQKELLLEWMAEQKGSAIAPSQPKAPAKRGTGRKSKEIEAPVEGFQHAHSQIGAEIEAIHAQIEGHVSQWEQAKTQQLAERFEAIPGNIVRNLNMELGGYSSDAESFRERIGTALSSAFPLG